MARAKPRAPRPRAAVSITENQRQILLQLFAGTEPDEIAAATGRTYSTINNTLQTVRKQFDARNDIDLMRECLRRGILSLAAICELADQLRRARHAKADRSPSD